LDTGAIKWARAVVPFDAWNASCYPFFGNGTNCPQPSGADYDFGQGPALFTVNTANGMRDLLGAGQKSGQYWALDPNTGNVVWVTRSARAATRAGCSGDHLPMASAFTLLRPTAMPRPGRWCKNGRQTGPVVTSGFWSALDAKTGAILWQTADPLGAGDEAAVTGANGVVYGCSLDAQGHMYALNAATGAILWSFASGGTCNAGAAVSQSTIYWGSGYNPYGAGTPNNKLYAFQAP